jgi:hypothetical protein
MTKNKPPRRYLFGIVEYRLCRYCWEYNWLVRTTFFPHVQRHCTSCAEVYWL